MLSSELLAKIFHINPEPMTLTRVEDGRYIAVNESFLRTFGYNREEVIGHTASELGIWENPERDRAQIVEQISSQGYASQIEAEFLTRAGEKIRIYLGATLIDDDEGPLLLLVGRDITTIRNSEEALRQSEQRFRGFVEHLPLGVLIIQDAMVRYANPASLEMLERTTEEILDQPFPQIIHPDDRQVALGFHHRRMQGDESDFCYDLRVVRKAGEISYWRINASANSWEGRIASLVVCEDVTEQKLAEQRMTNLALHDQITGLPNRIQFFDLVRQAIAQSVKGFAIIYLDLDGFKEVNDRFGHDVGDQVLQEVARRLRRSIREADTAARVGGDEFVALIRDVDNCHTAIRVAENIRLHLNRPVRSKLSEHHIGASIGISIYPADGKQLEELMQRADEAMYKSKRDGRNCVSCFSSEMAEEREAK